MANIPDTTYSDTPPPLPPMLTSGMWFNPETGKFEPTSPGNGAPGGFGLPKFGPTIPAAQTAVGGTGVSGVGAGAAAGTGILSQIPGILNTVGKVGTVLGGASGAAAGAQNNNNILDLARRKYNLDAPSQELAHAKSASMLANRQPSQAEWGGPGSGLKGQTVNFSGAFSNPNMISPDVKSMAEKIAHDKMVQEMSGESTIKPYADGAGGDALGSLALITSLLGALGGGQTKAHKL